jgi:hypothetical protein
MINNSAIQRWERLAAKQLDQMFMQRMMAGLNCSPFEAEAVLQNVHETYSTYFQCAPGLQPGQLSLQVVSIEAPPGPRLRQCPQLLVTLTLEDPATDLPARKKGGVTALRRHRLVRVCHEAFQQGGLLTLEDLAYRLFNCGQRTLCRDLQALRQHRIRPPLRSTVKDIGRTLSHRRQVVELWLAGHEYSHIAKTAFHCVTSVRNYVEKFKRVALLQAEGFDPVSIAFLARLSVPLTEQYLALLQHKKALRHRQAELRPPVKKNPASPVTPNPT